VSEPETHIAGTAEFESADHNLRKTMGLTDLLFMCLITIIGSAWLFAPLAGAAVAGPAVIISWAVGAALILLVAFSWMEPAGMLPRSGAVVRYPALTHGAYTGWLLGWAMWLSTVTIPAYEATAVVTYVGGQFPDSGIFVTKGGVSVLAWPQGILFAVGLMLVFFLLNLFGIRLLAAVNRWLTWWKLIIPLLAAIIMFTLVKGSNFTSLHFGSAHGFAPYGTVAIFEAIPTAGILAAFLGFRQAMEYAGEAKNPQRHVPLATVLSVVIAFGIYVLLQIGFIGAVDWHAAGLHVGDWAGLLGSSWASGPLVHALMAAGVAWLGFFAIMVVVDAGISPAATGWAYMGTGARTNYGMSIHGSLPKVFQRPNRWGIPWVSLAVIAVVGCVFLVPLPSWYLLVGYTSSATALTFVVGAVATVHLRRHAPGLHRPFRLPAVRLMAPLGFLASWMFVYWSGYSVLVQVYATVFLGLPLFVWYYARTKGWFETPAKLWLSQLLGLVFLGVWCYVLHGGGWVMRVDPPARGAWGFVTYYVAQLVTVLLFCAALWLLSNGTGRKHVERGMWLVVSLFALLPVSYYGATGPGKVHTIAFPWDTFIALGVGLVGYGLALASGFNTDELQQVVAASTVDRQPSLAPSGAAASEGESTIPSLGVADD
jgi:amino acid transporter